MSIYRTIFTCFAFGFVALNQSPAHGEDVFISQVDPAAASFEAPFADETNALRTTLQSEMGTERNVAHVVQSGYLNAAVQHVSGTGNVVLQSQQGNLLNSTVLLSGHDNGIAVDQQGSNFESNVIVNGENKLLIHFQRDAHAAVAAQPITMTGSDAETLLVLDTPFGRLTKSAD